MRWSKNYSQKPQPKFLLEPLEARLLLSADVLDLPIPTLQQDNSDSETLTLDKASPDSPVETDLGEANTESIRKLIDEGVQRLANLDFSAEQLEKARHVSVSVSYTHLTLPTSDLV